MSQEFNAPATPSVKVRGWVDPFHPQATAFGCVMAGTTVADAISKACKVARTRKRYMRRGLVYLGRKTAQGDYKWTRIPQSAWNKVRLKPNDSLTFRLLPEGGGGGKSPLRAILNIVVMAVAVVATVLTAGALAGLAGYASFAAMAGAAGATMATAAVVAGAALVGGLVMTMGQMLVDKIAPIKQQSLSTTAADQEDVYSLSGSSNTIDKWGTVPILFGKGNFAPKKAAAPYTELNSDDMYLHELFIWGECGSGDIKISNLKLGDTLITKYDNVEVETWRFDPKSPKYSKLYPTGVIQKDLSFLVRNKDDEGKSPNWYEQSFASDDKLTRISVDINFNALVKYDGGGNAKNCSVTFLIQYREKGTSTWKDSYIVKVNDADIPEASRNYTITAKSSSPVRKTFYLKDENGVYVGGNKSYDVRLRRTTADHNSESEEDTKIQDDAYWSALRGHTTQKPININYPVVLTAIRIKATDQLNGSISNLTGDYQVHMKNYNQSKKQWEVSATRDLIPAIRYVLQECSARLQPDSVIDWDNFIETDAYWKSLGWKYDKVLNSQTSVLNMVQDICAAGLASPTFIDGKWAVIVDKPRDEVVMGITSANSWGWSVDRVTSELPHIIQCDFINQATWESDMMEVEVDSSYKEEGRTPIYEKVTFDGVTIPNNVYKQARFHYADAKTQVRTISMTMWDESLVATRGDLVSLSQPYLIPAGLEAGRIKSVKTNEQGYITAVTTDVLNTVGNDTDGLGIKIYLSNGTIAHAKLAVNTTGDDKTKTLTFKEPITANIERGNKYTLGYYGEEDFLAVITSMKFNADFTCQLTCVDYIGEKYGVFDPNFEIPTFQSLITKPITASTSLTTTPVVINIITDERALIKVGNTVKSRAMFSFGVPSNIDSRAAFIRGQYRIHNTLDGSEDEIVPGKWVTFLNIPISETTGYCNEVEDGESYDFRFQYVATDGKTSNWKTTWAGNEMTGITVIGKTSPPPAIGNIYCETDPNKGIKLGWSGVNVLDLDHYSIIGAGIGGSIGNGVPDAEDEAVAIKTIDTQLWIMPYGAEGDLTYGVYAVDTLGNMSPTMATITAKAVPPKKPVPVFTKTQDGGVITWDDCKSLWEIDYYIVEDVHNGYKHDTIDRYLALTPRKAGYDYDFNITAVDIYGNTSEVANIGFTVENPAFLERDTEGNLVPVKQCGVSVKDTNLIIRWPTPVSLFPIAHYRIVEGSTTIAEVKSTEYSMVAPLAPAGSSTNTHSYGVIAVDIAGNESAPLEGSRTIYPPQAPGLVMATKNGSVLDITWEASVSDITVSHYIVKHYATDTVNPKVTLIPEYTLGVFDTTFVSIPAVITGTHTFTVTAVNASGTEGEPKTGTFTSVAPPSVVFEDCSPVDNNVMMRYTVDANKVFWPIKEYQIFDVEYLPDNTPVKAILGRTDTQFFADIKMQGGTYTYGIVTVDIVGNESGMVTRNVAVNQPPNFILYTDKDSTFNGIKTNMLLDGVGGMYGPIAYDDTWASNVSRVGSILSKSDDTVTWDDKVQNNMPFFFSPEGGSNLVGSYQEIVDVGTLVPSSAITVTVTSNTLSGNPTMTQLIETSEDMVTWSVVDTTGKALSKNFQYARITLTWTGGLIYVSDIHFQMASSEMNDAGNVIFTDEDYANNDPAIDSTDDEPIGKLVKFNKQFVDIIAFTGLTVRGTGQKSAYIIFKDTPNPTWFRVFILDKDGNRAPGQVDWSVKGV
ncbi:MAG: hypothetical protein IKW35_07755 [Paludibacteraceae bacterium]|nr:hypothetical protein [Paludibacteraceae bacterium]